MQGGPGGFRLQPEEARNAAVQPFFRDAAATGLQGQDRLGRFPGEIDGFGKNQKLIRFAASQRALDRPDREVAHQRQRDGGSVETPVANEIAQPRLVKLSERIKRPHIGPRLLVVAGDGARRRLNLVGRIRNRSADQRDPLRVGRLELASHDLGRLAKQFHQVAARDVRTRPDRQSEFTIVLRPLDEGR